MRYFKSRWNPRSALRGTRQQSVALCFGHIDRRTQEGSSRLHALLYACHPRLVNGITQHRNGDWFLGRPGTTRVAQKAELDRKAHAVLVSTTLRDQVQVRRRECVPIRDLSRIGRQRHQLGTLGGREDLLSGHGCSCGIGGRTVWLETIVFCHTVTACPNPPKNSEFRGAIAGGFFARGGRARALASRPASPPTTSRHCPCSSRPCANMPSAGDGPSPSLWRTSAQEFATAPSAKT